MRYLSSIHIVAGLILIVTASPCLSAEQSLSEPSSKYLDAVREFADNVLKYGRDTYGPKHTPLFVDGLNIHTHEPVKWISPKGDVFTATETEEWIPSNFASQQTLLRTLDGLTETTGDSKYRDAAKQAVKYAFENLVAPNGLLYWGHYVAYDAQSDEVKYAGGKSHILKMHYPYYELMWQVDPDKTEQFIESFWAAHVRDWSNLDFNRIAKYSDALEEAWQHKYDENAPTFFEGGGGGFLNTGSSLMQAGTTLHKLSGQQEPLVWSKRLAKRFVSTRHPMTGISKSFYNFPEQSLGSDLNDHFIDPHTTYFPWPLFEQQRELYYPENSGGLEWISILLDGRTLGSKGGEFTRWALEEFTAWGKAAYRKKDNSFVPILTDGTSIEGYVCKETNPFATKGTMVQPDFAGFNYFWAYALAYNVTGDEFMWKMSRNIGLGNSLGDIGQSPEDEADLWLGTDCSDVHGLLGFLELHNKTNKDEFLRMAERIGDNILASRFHKGFFVPSKKHIYAKFDCCEALALLHLHAASRSSTVSVPEVWPSIPLFVPPYRYKHMGVDRRVIYSLTESNELPLSLQEASAIGDIDVVRSLLSQGVGVDSWDPYGAMKKTALQRAAITGHKEVVELLIDNDAQVNYHDDWPGGTALHYAAEYGRRDIVELLIAEGANLDARRGYPTGDTPLHSAVRGGHEESVRLLIEKGADVNAKNDKGETPLDVVGREHRKDIIDLLIAKGAKVTSIHVAAQLGDMDKVKAFLGQGVDIDTADEDGMTALLLAISNKQAEVAKFLIERGADVNAENEQGIVPLYRALWNRDLEMVKLLLENGANANAYHAQTGYTPLHWALMMDSLESTKLVLAAGADVNTKSKAGETPLDFATYGSSPEIGGLLVSSGAEVSSLHAAAYLGDLERVKAFINEGADVKQKKGMLQNTPLHSAVAGGRKEIAEFLISKGADVNAQNRRDQTPLDLAQKAGHTDIIELLQKQTEVHNVSVTEVSAPASCVQGETVSIVVMLDNEGDAKESCDARLLDTADGREIAQRSAIVRSKYEGAFEADLTITGEVEDETEFGIWCNADGDVNGDGFKDLLITANHFPAKGVDQGRAYLYYGGTQMDNVPDKRFTGEERGDTFGDNAGFLVDMNNDGFADVILGARYHDNRGRVYVYWGGADMDEQPDITIDPPADDGTRLNFGRGGMHPGDFNGDGIMDLVCSAIGYGPYIGRVYLYYGPLASGTTVDKVFTGETPGGTFGPIIAVGDVNGDNCDDLLVATRYFPALNPPTSFGNVGRSYLYYGANGTSMDTVCDVMFDPPDEGKNEFGSSADIFDIDNDGFADVLIGARRYPDGNSLGRVYVYWGKSTGFDSTVGQTITGEAATISLGGDFINCDYANGDRFGDILVTAYDYNGQQSRAYLYYGGPQDKMDSVADHVFTPDPGRNGVFRSVLADVNGDDHEDVVMSGCYYNNSQGRAWLWYGPFAPSSTTVTFTWDTTNASLGKHTLKVEIPPVPGEQNTEDNVKTVTIEVKEAM